MSDVEGTRTRFEASQSLLRNPTIMLKGNSATKRDLISPVPPMLTMNINSNRKFNQRQEESDDLLCLKKAQQEALTDASIVQSEITTDFTYLTQSKKRSYMTSSIPAGVTPLAPLAQSSDRGRAFSSAVYYSECFLQGVTPEEADNAVQVANDQYRKWWVKASGPDQEHRKDDDFSANSSLVLSSKRKQTMGMESPFTSLPLRKRRRRRCKMRDLIDDFETERQRRFQRTASGAFNKASSTTELDPSGCVMLDRSFQIPSAVSLSIEEIRDEFIAELLSNGGNTKSLGIERKLELLQSHFIDNDCNENCFHREAMEFDGSWYQLTKPDYSGCQGYNKRGEPIYTLGRMAFDMYRPTQLRCSIQGVFNSVNYVESQLAWSNEIRLPHRLRRQIQEDFAEHGNINLRTYNTVVAFTIESGQPYSCRENKKSQSTGNVIQNPIRGIMINYAYMIPDPKKRHRYSIWFTGGSLEVNDELNDLQQWKRIFGSVSVPNRDMKEFARVLAAKVFLGAEVPDKMEPNGSLIYNLRRPIGGHGSAFCDLLYLDDKLRVMQGHAGSIFVFSKAPEL